MKKIIDHALLVLILMCIAAILIVGFWAFWPYDVIQHEITPLPLEKKVLTPGETISYHAKFEKFMNVSGECHAQLIDGMVWFYAPFDIVADKGEYDIWNRSFSVPQYVPPGDNYYLQFSNEFRVNPIRTIVETYRTETFSVVESK